jgi:hypothetical protein
MDVQKDLFQLDLLQGVFPARKENVQIFEDQMERALHSVERAVEKSRRFKDGLDKINIWNKKSLNTENVDENDEARSTVEMDSSVDDEIRQTEKALKRVERSFSKAYSNLSSAERALRDAMQDLHLRAHKIIAVRNTENKVSVNTTQNEFLGSGDMFGTFDLLRSGALLSNNALLLAPTSAVSSSESL